MGPPSRRRPVRQRLASRSGSVPKQAASCGNGRTRLALAILLAATPAAADPPSIVEDVRFDPSITEIDPFLSEECGFPVTFSAKGHFRGTIYFNADGTFRRYLVGDRFSVADLTAAALVFQLVRPPEAPYLLPPPSPPAVERFRAEASGRRAFEWVKEMYRRHRRRSAEIRADELGWRNTGEPDSQVSSRSASTMPAARTG